MKDKRVRKLTKGSRKSVGREGLPRPVPQGAWEYIQFPGQGIWINKTKVSVSISPTTPNLLIFVLSHAMEPPMNTDDQTEEFCLPTHCCLCPSPDYLPPAARSLFHRDLLYVLTNSAHNGSLSMCRFLAQDLSNVFQASPHRYLDRTPQVLRQDLTVPWGYLNRVHLLPLHLSTWKVFCFFFYLSIPMLQDQLKYHLLKEVFPEAPMPTPCLRYMYSHLLFPNSVITAPKKHTSIFFLISLHSESVNSLKISSIFSFLKHQG